MEMDSRPFPAPLPHGNPVPFPPRPESRLRTSTMQCLLIMANTQSYFRVPYSNK